MICRDGNGTNASRQVDRRGPAELAAGGPDAVRIESLARALGVTKGGFYGYFEDRRACSRRCSTHGSAASVDEVIDRVEAEGGDARARLRRLSALASSSAEVLRIDIAVRDWARRDKAVAKRLRRVDNRRMDYMRSLFGAICDDEGEVEARCCSSSTRCGSPTTSSPPTTARAAAPTW